VITARPVQLGQPEVWLTCAEWIVALCEPPLGAVIPIQTATGVLESIPEQAPDLTSC
jgi:hypothetical protein